MGSDGSNTRLLLPRRDLLNSTGLTPRDLRRIDPLLSLTSSSPVIVIRDTFLLIHVSAIRLAVFANYCILFDLHSHITDSFVNNLSSRLRNCTFSYPTTQDFSLEGPWESEDTSLDDREMYEEQERERERESYHSSMGNQPFEMDVLETAFYNATKELEEVLTKCTQRVGRLLQGLPGTVNASFLDELRVLKQELVGLDTRAGAVRQLLLEVLEDPEDVLGILISRFGVVRSSAALQREEEEVEGMLEYYLQRCEAYHSEAERLLENTRDMEESIRVSLSSRRFEVNKLELWLSVATFAITCGALVTGVFGMNLLSGLENHPTLFYWTLLAIAAAILLITACIFVYISSRLYTHARTKTPKLVLKEHKKAKKSLKKRIGSTERRVSPRIVHWNKELQKDMKLDQQFLSQDESNGNFGIA
eukprot:CAMPEP_0196585886 /NCGR_PEP_ID=MMETSP1081-20130531/52421_1 /TAXON_ID=36882 /ORGANISM="Pyramimonas amylifera, Strain CCMP720" /LENGTH=418 /DNA_ID=CAMNT_0041907583 /DNA_START=252 /DNA_END=1508 /DNA_ORIENTATION=+